ncbi:origin of replication complex subunit 1B-like [Euphorbia lathyris]|uniref:origin of replication complex subunit 1B-like n=1 Tax=Euphorbia lathyris TaxID=212925 RepID=UPI003313559A
MADTPKKFLQSPSKKPKQTSPSSILLTPQTPHTVDPPRRSTRRLSLKLDEAAVPQHSISQLEKPTRNPVIKENPRRSVGESTRTRRNSTMHEPEPSNANEFERTPKSRSIVVEAEDSFSPISVRESTRTRRNLKINEPSNANESERTPKPRSKVVEAEDSFSPISVRESTRTRRNSKINESSNANESERTPKSRSKVVEAEDSFYPVSSDQSEIKKRKRHGEEETKVLTRAMKSKNSTNEQKSSKKRVYYKKVVYDGGEFEVGDDVYVKRREDANSDGEEPEVEECRVCFKAGKSVLIECDDCLGGFHLKCLKPPLKMIPEGDWICGFCEAKKLGKDIMLPAPPKGKKLARTLREKLLSSDLWAARIESLWKEMDGSYWFKGRWYMIPEETAGGRQPHNLKRELYRTNESTDTEMESILQHCYVMSPKEYAKATNQGDDIFLCEYEYDIRWHTFKRIAEIDNDDEDGEDADSDEDWIFSKEAESDTDEDIDYEKENLKELQAKTSTAHDLAANLRKGQFFGLQKIGVKRIPEHVRCHKKTELEKAKATLLLATLPKSPPCRNKEMEEISAFIKGAICDDQCLGRCLYIYGVPGTGKTMSVHAVLRNLKSEVDSGNMRPYSFVEVNGLKLASAENIYRVIYEALSGYRVGWKKALQLLNERFSEGKVGNDDNRPCILLIDELDLLVTRNQSVLYNILDWPTRPHSQLIVIGIANTMDLPEKLLPRISSRLGIQRLCFGPYKYQQLQEIISSRLKGIDAFENQAIEFASRKVAAISGDARRALEICRRAAEIADYRLKHLSPKADLTATGKGLVGMSEVEAAIQEMFQAPHIQVMKSCSRISKIFLTAMVYELYKTGMSETTFEKLATTVSSLCTSNGEHFPGWDALLKVGCLLGESRIIICESGARHMLQKLQLNFPSDDVAFALKGSNELSWLAKYL